jgi:hypothetical protein
MVQDYLNGFCDGLNHLQESIIIIIIIIIIITTTTITITITIT